MTTSHDANKPYFEATTLLLFFSLSLKLSTSKDKTFPFLNKCNSYIELDRDSKKEIQNDFESNFRNGSHCYNKCQFSCH